MICDTALPSLYTMSWFLLKRLKGGMTWETLMNLAPFEFELFHNMAVKDLKDDIEKNQKEQDHTNVVVSQLYKMIAGTK